MANTLWPVIVLSAPFYLNDFPFILFRESFYAVVIIDYGTRIFAIGASWFYLRDGSLTARDLGLVRLPLKLFLKWAVILSVAGVVIDQTDLGRLLYPFAFRWSLFKYPAYPNAAMKSIDLTFGMILIGFSEEIVFRGALLSYLKALNLSRNKIVLVSCILFGLIHWSSGPNSVITSALWGILPAMVSLSVTSIYPAVVAHVVTDFVAFCLRQ